MSASNFRPKGKIRATTPKEFVMIMAPSTVNRRDATSLADGPRILVVDDSAFDRKLVGAVLERTMNAQTLFAEDGSQALEILDRTPLAAVLTDLQMGVMNGLQLVTEIRARHPRVPVILMTAFGSEDVAIQALRVGASSYVAKKSLVHDLEETLRQILAVAAGDRCRQRLMGCLERSEAYFRLENDPSLVTPLIQVFQDDLERINFCDETGRMRVGVALQESLTNAIYHGNLEVSSDLRQEDERHFYNQAADRRNIAPFCDRHIHVTAQIDSSAARFTIRDEGPGFDIAKLDKPIDPEDLLRVGGRGMLLIRTFMDEISHNAEGNQITLIKRSQPRGFTGSN